MATIAPKRAAFAEESAEVEVLFANMDKLKGLTKKIQGSLNRLESSGSSMQDAISPIYGNTQKLQVTNNNVDRILEVLARMKETREERGQEGDIIRSDPRKVGLSEYISSLRRTSRTLAGLQRSALKSNQQAMQELTDLIRFGSKQLDSLFKDLLKEDSRAIEPLHYLTKNLEFPALSSDKISQLRMINSYISTSHSQMLQDVSSSPTTLTAYANIRGEYLVTSLRNLAAACQSTARKTSADALYRPRTNGFAAYSSAWQKMMSVEYRTIEQVFEPTEVDRAALSTCQLALREFNKALKELEAHIRANANTDCFLAFEILEIMNYDTVAKLRQLAPPLAPQVIEAGIPMRNVASSAFALLLDDARMRINSITALPQDGGAVQATTDIMTRLQALTNYLNAVISVLMLVGEGGWSRIDGGGGTSFAGSKAALLDNDVDGSGAQLFAQYATDMVEMTLSALQSRMPMLLKFSGTQGVFMANNISVIERMIRMSDLGPLLQSLQPKLTVWHKKATNRYMDAWKDAYTHLMEVQYTSRSQRPTSGAQDSAAVVKTLSSKEKDTIKERFKSFNMSFDDLVAKHKTYKMEGPVRQELGKEVQKMFEPMYGRFWDRYHELDKGKGKYVKYDKSQLNVVLVGMQN